MLALLIDLLFTRVHPCSSTSLPEGFGSCRSYWDHVADDMKMRSYELAGYWALIVAGCFIGYALVFFGFGTASEGLNKRIRDMAFTALCRQEVAYFDKRSVGSITSQLQDDAAKIHAFSGQPIRIFLINLSSVIAGVIISFVYMWPVSECSKDQGEHYL
jgi:ATP-binding cassette subfamily B (MDR/TAP) protein 1